MTIRADLSRTPRFDRMRQVLPEPWRTLLLKDTIFELTGAWKFFTHLSATQAVLFYLPGFSAMPLAFARHVARVDLFGLAPEEQELIAEMAAAKALANLRCLHSLADLQPPYATIVLMPELESWRQPGWQELQERLHAGAHSAEEYWLILRHSGRRRLRQHGEKFLRTILRRPKLMGVQRYLRPGFMADGIAGASQAAKFFPVCAQAERLMLTLAPCFPAPRHISIAPEKPSMLSHVHAEKPAHAEHVICAQRPAAQAFSYLERLLRHLTLVSKQSWRPAGAMRVLPGGKVQVVLHQEGTPRPAALLKLPLIPYAAARMRENAGHLLRLSQALELLPEQRECFPHHLAAGQFEAQAYYLETFLPGCSLDQLPATAHTARQWHNIFRLWFEIQQRLARRVQMDDRVLAGLIGEHARDLQAWLSPGPVESVRLQRVVAYCYEVFAGRELALSLVHGDFSIKNILIDPSTQEVRGVIDWDLADFLSAPPLDVLHFFVRTDERSFHEPAPAIALRLIKDRTGRHTSYFDEACERYGYRRADWPALVLMYWLLRLRAYLGSDKNMDAKFVRRQFSDMLELFEREPLAPRIGVAV